MHRFRGHRPAAAKKAAAKKQKKATAGHEEEEEEDADEKNDSDEEGDAPAEVAGPEAKKTANKIPLKAKKTANKTAVGSDEDDDDTMHVPMCLVKGPWTGMKQKLLLARLPKAAQPRTELAPTSKSYTLSLAAHTTRIQVILDKPIYYVKGAEADKVAFLCKSFNKKFKVDNQGGVSIPLREDPYGSFAHAMGMAGWTVEEVA